jgi:hypothetical protein
VRGAGCHESHAGQLLGLIEKAGADLATADHSQANVVHRDPFS